MTRTVSLGASRALLALLLLPARRSPAWPPAKCAALWPHSPYDSTGRGEGASIPLGIAGMLLQLLRLLRSSATACCCGLGGTGGGAGLLAMLLLLRLR
jgi:hypothetical protein